MSFSTSANCVLTAVKTNLSVKDRPKRVEKVSRIRIHVRHNGYVYGAAVIFL